MQHEQNRLSLCNLITHIILILACVHLLDSNLLSCIEFPIWHKFLQLVNIIFNSKNVVKFYVHNIAIAIYALFLMPGYVHI